MPEQFPLRAVVAPAALRLGVRLADRQLDQLSRLCEELLVGNERANLTSVTDPDEIAVRHVLDSLTAVPIISRLVAPSAEASVARAGRPDTDGAPRLVDVGAGGGFPGIPVAIALPGVDVTLVDATAKKVAFLDHVVEVLGLPNVRAVHRTAEELARIPEHRETYDVAMARAVASTATLVELLVPLLRIDGHAIVMKKWSAVEAELAQAAPALDALRVEVEQVVDVSVDDLLPDRGLAVLRKRDVTPDRFPRRPGVPRRRPLIVAPRG